MKYRLFDIVVECPFVLPELPVVKHSPVTLQIEYADYAQLTGMPFEHVLSWTGPAGQVIGQVARSGNKHLFELEGYARFVIEPGLISCAPSGYCSQDLLRHLLVNQVIPRYLGSSGRLLVHASAVTLSNGKTVLFVGPSGYGKSTLATALMGAGARLVADDCLLLEPQGDQVSVIGAFAGARLYPDMLRELLGQCPQGIAGIRSVAPYTDKQQVVFNQQDAHAGQWPVADALYVLGNPEELETTVRVKPLGGALAMMAMLESVFSLHPTREAATVQAFQALGEIFGPGLKCFSLQYPRRINELSAVMGAVVDSMDLQPANKPGESAQPVF